MVLDVEALLPWLMLPAEGRMDSPWSTATEGCRLERYYLGTHETSWLRRPEFAVSDSRFGGALFISHGRLRKLKKLRPGCVPFAVDSMGFTVLSTHGRWSIGPLEYVDAVDRYATEIGNLEWAAPQDWMCEPVILARTGLTVEEHQQRTVENFLYLKELWEGDPSADSSPFMPVIQGWSIADYVRCVGMYEEAGVDLTAHPVVGVGSVCRRQATGEIGAIFRELSRMDIRLHGFGVKTGGLKQYGRYLTSADSMSWSFTARKRDPLPGCTHSSCANCPRFALEWRDRVTSGLYDPSTDDIQLDLFDLCSQLAV